MTTGQVSDRFARGQARLEEISGQDAQAFTESLRDIAPDLARYVVEFAYGDVHSRPGLNAADRQLAVLGALVAQGDTQEQVRRQTGIALHVGLEPRQVVEAVTHLILVVGIPRVLNALVAVRAAIEERGLKADPIEVGANTERQRDRYAYGEARLRQIAGDDGVTVIRALDPIAPDLGRYIVEFAWGEVYDRPGISVRERQLATLGAMIGFGDTPKQQKTHFKIALRQGLTPEELVELVIQVAPKAGFPRVLNALAGLREVLDERGLTV
ncbi:carboxymuconolactone decarboxylase family protein [Streptomyces achromogenes]|uniref:carboxymuconolactone decarboxylase family protein n=1 Tax=Streptomyces achromogenes TaxID=67255 RepID=UPI0037D1F7C1